ncbi:hypothetical protein KI688_002558 [Linnemannia hyalina]|uniref:Uncharacterized protein n=1 Tax=Linnemannia hyalina TaxID=64524 RepID=A0A9P7XPX1_9FUNG|nr:hypothetical protein KI688_002558 [Linnemannia hyalina]
MQGIFAIQIIPKVAESEVKVLHVYGRNPGYVTHQFDDAYSTTWKLLFRKIPLFYFLYATLWYYALVSTFLVYFSLTWYSALHRAIFSLAAWWHRYRQIPDPILRAKLTPTRMLGSRRTVLSNNYYPALTQGHVNYHLHQSVTSVVEAQVMFMIKSLSTMMGNDYASMEITEKATYKFANLAQRRSASRQPPLAPAAVDFPQKKRQPPTKGGVRISFWCGTLAEFRYRLSNYSPQLFTATRHEQ